MRKVWNEKKLNKDENSPPLSSPRNRQCRDGNGGTVFPWLAEGGWLVRWWDSNWIEGGRCGQLKRNSIWKKAVRKKWNGGGKNKREGKTHRRCILQASWQQWALDPLIDWGRAASTANWWAIYLQKEAMRNNWNGGGKNKGRGNSRQSPSAGELQDGSDGPLIL